MALSVYLAQCFRHSCHRRRRYSTIIRPLSLCRFVAVIVILLLCISAFVLCFYTTLLVHFNYCCSQPSDVIVSLTTTPARFQFELPITIHSLLTQTTLPREIRIYLSPAEKITEDKNLTADHLKMNVEHIDGSRVIKNLFERLVRIRMEKEDYGPATKFLPVIEEFHEVSANVSTSQAIIICDDDHYYHPHTIATLLEHSIDYANSIVGLRGWRIREDLTWGVSGQEEISYHIIESARLSSVYRVGVVTANNAYLIRPSFFDSHIYRDFNQAPADIRRVDDIWLNGYASKRNITRLVVPACCRSTSVTRTHELENYLIAHHISRSSANDHALRWFNQTWEKDLWYRFEGKNRPHYRSGWRTIYREWLNVILRLRFILSYGLL